MMMGKNIKDTQIYVIVGAIITMNGKDTELEIKGTIADALRSMDIPPNTFLFLVDGIPIPSDTPLREGMRIQTIKVASGG